MLGVQLLRVAAFAAVVQPLRALVYVQHHTPNFAFLPLENFKYNPYN